MEIGERKKIIGDHVQAPLSLDHFLPGTADLDPPDLGMRGGQSLGQAIQSESENALFACETGTSGKGVQSIIEENLVGDDGDPVFPAQIHQGPPLLALHVGSGGIVGVDQHQGFDLPAGRLLLVNQTVQVLHINRP